MRPLTQHYSEMPENIIIYPEPVPPICRYLRSKSGLGYTEGGDEPWLLLDAGTAVSQCLRTMEPFGPDDGYAEPAACQVGRVCFAAPDAA